MIKRFIEQEMLASDSWGLLGMVNLSLMRDKLRTGGFQRIPNDNRLVKIIREINNKHSDSQAVITQGKNWWHATQNNPKSKRSQS